MKGIGTFGAGILVGALLVLPAVAQPRDASRRALNHVGIVVADYHAALRFYTEGFGFREAYTIRRPNGNPLLTYLQLNRETFVELIPAGPNQQTGITHFGLEVGDIDATVAHLRELGIEVGDPGLTPAQAQFTRVTDRDDVQIEVMEFGPESQQRLAMDAWK